MSVITPRISCRRVNMWKKCRDWPTMADLSESQILMKMISHNKRRREKRHKAANSTHHTLLIPACHHRHSLLLSFALAPFSCVLFSYLFFFPSSLFSLFLLLLSLLSPSRCFLFLSHVSFLFTILFSFFSLSCSFAAASSFFAPLLRWSRDHRAVAV